MMPFKNHCYFMHRNAMDTFIEVLKVSFVGPDYVKLKVIYSNLGCTGHPYPMVQMNLFVVEAKDYGNWVQLTDEQISTPRTKPGIPILKDLSSKKDMV